MIFIGAAYRGLELKDSEINRVISAASVALEDLREPFEYGKHPSVVAVFIVPGSLGGANFKGLQYGEYSRKDRSIVVQIAVPASLPENDLITFLVDSLHGVNAMAFAFFEQKKESFPLRQAEELVTTTGQRLRAESTSGENVSPGT